MVDPILSAQNLTKSYAPEQGCFSIALDVIQIQQNYYYKESHSLFEKSSIFQPPKLA